MGTLCRSCVASEVAKKKKCEQSQCGAEPRRSAAHPPLTLTASRALIDRLPHVDNATTARHVYSLTVSHCAGQRQPCMHCSSLG